MSLPDANRSTLAAIASLTSYLKMVIRSSSNLTEYNAFFSFSYKSSLSAIRSAFSVERFLMLLFAFFRSISKLLITPSFSESCFVCSLVNWFASYKLFDNALSAADD